MDEASNQDSSKTRRRSTVTECVSYSVTFFFLSRKESARRFQDNSTNPIHAEIFLSSVIYPRYRPVRTQTTGYLNLQSCVRYVTFTISAGTNRGDDRFPSEHAAGVFPPRVYICVHICIRKRNNALTTLADSPGEAQIRCRPLSFPLISDKAISIYRAFVRFFLLFFLLHLLLLLLLRPLVTRFLSSLILE